MTNPKLQRPPESSPIQELRAIRQQLEEMRHDFAVFKKGLAVQISWGVFFASAFWVGILIFMRSWTP